MFFHTNYKAPRVSGGTSSAGGPNSTWSTTINPPRLTQTPHPPNSQSPNTRHSSGKSLDFTTSCQVFSLGRRLLETSEEDVGSPPAVNILISLTLMAPDMPADGKRGIRGNNLWITMNAKYIQMFEPNPKSRLKKGRHTLIIFAPYFKNYLKGKSCY